MLGFELTDALGVLRVRLLEESYLHPRRS